MALETSNGSGWMTILLMVLHRAWRLQILPTLLFQPRCHDTRIIVGGWYVPSNRGQTRDGGGSMTHVWEQVVGCHLEGATIRGC